MDMIADFLLVAGALSAGFYCFILSRKLNEFRDAESGIGPAVAALSAQVDELTRSVAAARSTAQTSSDSLTGLTERAESVAQRLELMIASMHDIPEHKTDAPTSSFSENPVFSTRMSRAAGES